MISEPLRRFRAVSAAALMGVLAVAGAAEAASGRSIRELSASADSLQRCLEQDPAMVQLDSTLMRDGRIEDSLRVTRGPFQCRNAMSEQGASCPAMSTGIHRSVHVRVQSVDRHPAWSPNEHARLHDGLAALATQIQSGLADPRDAALILTIRSEFTGVAALQQQLDEWVKGPRAALIKVELLDGQRGGKSLGQREVKVSLAPAIRSRVSTDIHSRWLRDSLAAVTTAADQLLKPAHCAEPSFNVTLETRELQLDTRGYVGLSAGVAFLLVPRAEAAAARGWPVARVKSVNFNRVAALELLRGDKTACTTGCIAIPL
jgi:hypothetical protein